MTVAEFTEVVQRVFRAERIAEDQAPQLETFYRARVAEVLAALSQRGGKPMVLGICGSQGSGKSTLALVLQAVLKEVHGLAIATLSLDDLYLSSAKRALLSCEVHPLLRTRGVPGTHAVELGTEVIQRLLSAGSETVTRIPRFDKALDEPQPAQCWPEFHGRADVVIFEGWCVGVKPQAPGALVEPLNELERLSDAQGRWRQYVNLQVAGRYGALFALLDRLLMLRAPGFEAVFEWRREQERKLAARLSGSTTQMKTRLMSDEELKRFIMHYERLTRHILHEMPSRADVVAHLDRQRRIVRVDA